MQGPDIIDASGGFGQNVSALLGLAAQFSGCATAPKSAHPLDWLTDLPAAEARAKTQGKVVFVDFQGSDWCTGCILMHREIFPTPQFRT